MRYLVLMHEGDPVAVDTFAGPIRRHIEEHPADDVDLWGVREVAQAGSYAPSIDITEQFARTWAMELATGATLEQHLAGAPAFVVHHARVDLTMWWQRRAAEQDENFVPVLLKSARFAA